MIIIKILTVTTIVGFICLLLLVAGTLFLEFVRWKGLKE
jgi:hypothetical protein